MEKSQKSREEDELLEQGATLMRPNIQDWKDQVSPSRGGDEETSQQNHSSNNADTSPESTSQEDQLNYRADNNLDHDRTREGGSSSPSAESSTCIKYSPTYVS